MDSSQFSQGYTRNNTPAGGRTAPSEFQPVLPNTRPLTESPVPSSSMAADPSTGVFQPTTGPAPQPLTSPSTQPPMPGSQPVNSGQILNQLAEQERRDKIASLLRTIGLAALGLTTITFIGLFIWAFSSYNAVKMDIDGQVSLAVAEAERAQAAKDEEEFSEREKYPFYTFSGPADYGGVTFEYPKNWSVYIAADAVNGGDYEAYFNPREVYSVASGNLSALRFMIRDASFESVVAEYEKANQEAVKNKTTPMTVESITLANGTTANRYTGVIPGTEFYGYIVIFKVRDKTAVFQTDSANNFANDFNTLLDSIKFNI